MANERKSCQLSYANRLGQDNLKNCDSSQYKTEFEEDKFKLRRDLFTYILESTSNEREALKHNLQNKYESLSEWNAHYDYANWSMVEDHFNSIWLDLEHEMYLGVEYGLYEEVKKLFLELRNFLQGTDRIKDRIFFAAWLRREAENLGDLEGMCFATSSLVWSYTSSGHYKDLEKAYALWHELILYLLPKDSSVVCEDCKSLKDTLKCSLLYAELLMEVQENGVRLAIRKREFDKAFMRIEKGKSTIKELFEGKLVSQRLRERCYLAFNYHKGIVFYLMEEYREAEKLFQNISERAEIIGWNRAIKGAKSWLATLAMEKEDHSKCEDILRGISTQEETNMHDKRDVLCYLIRSENFHKAGKQEQAQESKEIALSIFKKCSKNELESGIDSLVLLSSKK